VAVPVLDPDVRRQLDCLVDLQLADDVKARRIDARQSNRYVARSDGPPVRSQEAFRDFVASLAAESAGLRQALQATEAR
jgi:polyphosphate kinase